MNEPRQGLYIVLISVHGLIRGNNMELGRDADTGGQIKYVVELAQALGKHPDVNRVDLFTRQVFDQKVSDDYAQTHEVLSDKVTIIRLPCGPRRYLRKEVLWPYLDNFTDNILQHLSRIGRVPDIVHSHYADAGYVGTRLVQLLGIPLLFTGHSLGRVKRQRLLEKGSKADIIESQYNMTQRIEAEEVTLGNAILVVASTHQEVQQQYELYDNYHPRRMMVIPPGVDLNRFQPRDENELLNAPIKSELDRFLKYPDRPLIMAMSRADERKTISSLLRAYGEHKELQKKANLVIVAGNRDDIATMEKGPRDVLSNILLLIDKYDLYGKVAYPKHHLPQDVADLYQLVARSKGVFVNPAFTEPFGLTLIEAAACGVPIVSTKDGGPRDIVATLENGILIDPLDINDIAAGLTKVLDNKDMWQHMSQNGCNGAHQFYSWDSHIKTYINAVKSIISKPRRLTDVSPSKKNRLPTIDRILVSDIDNTLIGDEQALYRLLDVVHATQGKVGFGVATGRSIESTLEILRQWNVPTPDLLITSVGSEIHYGHRMVEDSDWHRHINYRWHPTAIKKAMRRFPGLKLQTNESEQRKFKISYNVDPAKMPPIRELSSLLRQLDLHVKLVYSHQAYLDILPIRASKGLAVRYIAMKWGIPADRILVAGDSGNDEEMLKGNTLGVVVGNYSKELAKLKGRDRIFFAQQHFANGIREGMEYYGFLNETMAPAPELDYSEV